MTTASKITGGNSPRKTKMTTFTTEDREQAQKFVPSNIPYNNGKVKIGVYYERPRYVEYDQDMLLLQSHLIEDPKVLRMRYISNMLYTITLAFTVIVIWLSV